MSSLRTILSHQDNFEEVNAQKHIWSARITRNVRALGIRDRDEITWYWIGTHREYEKRKK